MRGKGETQHGESSAELLQSLMESLLGGEILFLDPQDVHTDEKEHACTSRSAWWTHQKQARYLLFLELFSALCSPLQSCSYLECLSLTTRPRLARKCAIADEKRDGQQSRQGDLFSLSHS